MYNFLVNIISNIFNIKENKKISMKFIFLLKKIIIIIVINILNSNKEHILKNDSFSTITIIKGIKKIIPIENLIITYSDIFPI